MLSREQRRRPGHISVGNASAGRLRRLLFFVGKLSPPSGRSVKPHVDLYRVQIGKPLQNDLDEITT